MPALDFHSAPLAIVGMACRFPGADSLDEFWDLLHAGRCSITQLSHARLNRDLYYAAQRGVQGRSYTCLGGEVPFRPVDPDLWTFPPEMARQYTPFHQTLCEVAAAACRHAGYAPGHLPSPKGGVYIGNASGDDHECNAAFGTYSRSLVQRLANVEAAQTLPPAVRAEVVDRLQRTLASRYSSRRADSVFDTTSGTAAALVARALQLTGPCQVADAACASSFSALLLAAQALHRNQIDWALVGSASYRNWYELVLMSQAQSIGDAGSFPFDARASGLIAADGYTALVLKTLPRALADGDRVLAVIRNLGLSSDGRGKSFWAPRKEGQTAAIRRAYDNTIDPARIQYVEAHATSTQLGDATEIASLVDAFPNTFSNPIPIASVKANIGHTLETAGFASLIKTVLALQHGVIPPAANFETPNPAIEWNQIPFFVPRQPIPWPAFADGHPRRAAVDSFGIGGLNTHLVLDEYLSAAETARISVPQELVASDPLSDEPIALVGVGSIFPGAPSVDAFRDLLEQQHSALSEAPADRWDRAFDTGDNASSIATAADRPRGGYLTDFVFDWKRFKIPPIQVARGNPLQFLLVAAADQAMNDAGYAERPFDRTRTAAVVGTIFGGDFADETYLGLHSAEVEQALAAELHDRNVPQEEIAQITAEYRKQILERLPAALDETASLSCSTLASRLTKLFDLGGGAFAVDAGDSSALAAISAAVNLLRQRTVDLVVCAAGQRWMDQLAVETLALRQTGRDTATADGQPRLPGEGAGVLVLKRLADARRDGDRVRAVIHDVSAVSDGDSLETATRDAVAAAHRFASGDPLAVERAADLDRQIGHTFAASGMAATLAAAVRVGGVEDAGVPASKMHADSRCLRCVVSADGSGFAGIGGTAWTLVLANAASPVQSVTESEASIREVATAESSLGGGRSGMEGLYEENAMGRAETATSGQITPSTELRATLRRSLIHFVSELNGFPPEVIELDADLEHQLYLDREMQQELVDELKVQFALETNALEEAFERQRIHTLRDVATLMEQVLTDAAASKTGSPQPVETAPVVTSGSTDAQPLPAANERTMRRLLLRMVDRPLPAGSPAVPQFAQPVLVLGSNPVATIVCDRLRKAGVVVHELPVSLPPEAVLAALDRLWQQTPAPHLILLSARDEDAAVDVLNDAAWRQRSTAGVQLPWLVVQRWFAHVERDGLIEQATLAAVSALGGDFGLAGHGQAVEGGGLAGLLKALSIETRRRLRTKIVDVPAREPAAMVATELLGELAAQAPEIEVGYLRGKRSVIQALPQTAPAAARQSIARGGVWVVTGGARGVTAVAARELGRRFGLRLHLLGTSPLPEIDPSWRSLSADGLKELRTKIVREALQAKQNGLDAWSRTEKAIEMEAAFAAYREAGVAVTYHQCDVGNHAQLKTVLERVRAADGPISGILHGAGLEVAGRFTKKQPALVERVLSSKVQGAASLMALTRDDPLSHFVGFGSTSGRFGAYLNADYALANDLLAKLIDRYAHLRPEVRAVTMHWTAWDDVGMAANDRSRYILDAIHVTPMPPLEGVAHLVDELTADSRESEILICDHPGGVHSDDASMVPETEWSDVLARARRTADAPLIDVVHANENDGVAFLTFDPTHDPFLTGHRDDGTPLLPAVIGIESSAEAASILSGGRTIVGVRDVKLLSGFRMAHPRPHHARLRVSLHAGEAVCQLSGEFYDKQGRMTDPDRLFQSCIVELADAPRAVAAPNLGTPPDSGWIDVPYPDDWRDMADANSGTVYYGPELRSLKAVWHDAHGAWGRLVAPAVNEIGGRRRGSQWHTPPSMLDALLFACDLFASYRFGTRQLPHVIDHVAIARLPRTGEQCLARVIYRGREANRYTWDFWFLGDDGQTILGCTGCHFVDLNISLTTHTA